ncbi:hypothetical protein RND81_07G051800 [Saponaria officinalis]|uniref:Uncharacterized protein n=1 Tax=Saponaria officinalis TaxID=3572 RepID=A0AAW1JM32_SAPOF
MFDGLQLYIFFAFIYSTPSPLPHNSACLSGQTSFNSPSPQFHTMFITIGFLPLISNLNVSLFFHWTYLQVLNTFWISGLFSI